MSDKSEEATPKRLLRAQEEGDSPISAFASQAIAFLCAVLVAPLAIAALASRATTDLRSAIAHAGDASVTASLDARALATSVVLLSAPILAAAAAGAAVTSLVQSGGIVASRRLQPRLERLGVVRGLAQLFTLARLVAVLRAALFGAAVAWFAVAALRDHAADLARATGRLPEATGAAAEIAYGLAKRVALLGVLLALLDVALTRQSWRRRLRMSRQEVLRERKESGRNPELDAARARARQAMMAAASLANVARSSVVIRGEEGSVQSACALRYDREAGDEAPVVVASGRGELARQIEDAARAAGVVVLEDGALARELVELGGEEGAVIPEALYERVAESLRVAWAEEDARGG